MWFIHFILYIEYILGIIKLNTEEEEFKDFVEQGEDAGIDMQKYTTASTHELKDEDGEKADNAVKSEGTEEANSAFTDLVEGVDMKGMFNERCIPNSLYFYDAFNFFNICSQAVRLQIFLNMTLKFQSVWVLWKKFLATAALFVIISWQLPKQQLCIWSHWNIMIVSWKLWKNVSSWPNR